MKIQTNFSAAALAAVLLSAAAPARAARTIVTLGFDDSTENQMTAVQMLNQRGLKGTFYVISGLLGTSGGFYMTQADINAIAAAGHEIAGHTLTHPDLTTISTSAVQHEICDGRAQLVSMGFNPVSFAYPYGSYNAAVESIAQSCYANARTVGGVGCPGCINGETTPPQDAWAIRSPDSLQDDTPLATIEKYVTDAENSGGGWVPLVIHQICNGCDTYSISSATLAGFLDWLTPRSSLGTIVETNAQVMSGAPPPPPPPNPVPSISGLSPATAVSGSSAFTLTIKGSGFAAASSVRWNGQARAATVVDAGTLRAAIPASDLTSPATALVTVFNPAPGGGTSASQPFTVTVPLNPVPAISSLSPAAAVGAAFTLTVGGSGFAAASSVRWNGQARATTFVGPGTLQAAILASDLTSPATALVTVFNPAPGGGTSASEALVVANPKPTIAAVSPSTATAGDPGFNMAVLGANFVNSSIAIVNGQNRGANFVSSARMDVPILARDLMSPTTVTLTVANPAPGGGSSTAKLVVLQQPGAAPAAPGSGMRVYPNPWRADQHSGIDVTVDGLNPGSEVRFFTVSGRWVRTISTVNGAGKWDLTNDSGQRVASGLYFYLATDPAGGDQHGTLAIIQ